MNDIQVKFPLLNNIRTWAEGEQSIKAAIISGSLVRNDHPGDDFADLDLEIFCDDPNNLVKNNLWMENISNVWVWIPEKSNEGYPARLVIFEGGYKVDFTFSPLEKLEKWINNQELPDALQTGYQFIIDRNNYSLRLKTPTYTQPVTAKPSQDEFLAVVNEFWFEAWHVAKYIKRNDLWLVKFRDNGVLKEDLLKMIEWHSLAKHDWNINVWYGGHYISEWADPDIYSSVHTIFGTFDRDSSKKALEACADLFIRVSREVVDKLNFEYPSKIEQGWKVWLEKTKI